MTEHDKPQRARSTAAIDDHVAARIRERRSMLGLNQRQLGALIGVTPQRMHAYERGVNRVSVGRLYELAGVLNVPIAYFYEGLGEPPPQPVALDQRMRDIARNFAEIKNKRLQEAFTQLARVLATPREGGRTNRLRNSLAGPRRRSVVSQSKAVGQIIGIEEWAK